MLDRTSETVLVPGLSERSRSCAHRSVFLPRHSEVCQTRSSPGPKSLMKTWCYKERAMKGKKGMYKKDKGGHAKK